MQKFILPKSKKEICFDQKFRIDLVFLPKLYSTRLW